MSTQGNMTQPLSQSVSRHVAGVSLNGPLAMSLVAVSLVGLAVVVGGASLFASVFRGSIHNDQPKAVIDDLVAKHDMKIDEYQERFKQRYVFFKPPPPPPPPRVQRDEPPPPPPPPVDDTPKVPAVYQGPSIAWVIGDDVYFTPISPTQTEKYFRVGVGEEQHGVKVLSTEKLPRTVRVAHMGGEYDVKVFGDTMNSNTLFPIASTGSSRPSITVPGFITVPESGAPVEPNVAPETIDAETLAETNGEEPGDIDDDTKTQPDEPAAERESRRGSTGDRRRGSGRGERPQRPDGGMAMQQPGSISFISLPEALAPVSRS